MKFTTGVGTIQKYVDFLAQNNDRFPKIGRTAFTSHTNMVDNLIHQYSVGQMEKWLEDSAFRSLTAGQRTVSKYIANNFQNNDGILEFLCTMSLYPIHTALGLPYHNLTISGFLGLY